MGIVFSEGKAELLSKELLANMDTCAPGLDNPGLNFPGSCHPA
jgi:hypothetical protein